MKTKVPFNLSLCVFLILAASCQRKAAHSSAQRTPAEEIWVKAESDYRTNNPQEAFRLLLRARNELSEMWGAQQPGLNYAPCLAVLNGRLYVLATSLDLTNEAEAFLRESMRDWNLNRKNLRLPPTNYTTAEIVEKVEQWDEKVRPR